MQRTRFPQEPVASGRVIDTSGMRSEDLSNGDPPCAMPQSLFGCVDCCGPGQHGTSFSWPELELDVQDDGDQSPCPWCHRVALETRKPLLLPECAQLTLKELPRRAQHPLGHGYRERSGS